jgi:group I intron endonuclease
MTYSLYVVTNKNNGKTYVGITGRNIARRFSEHVCHAKYEINKGAFYKAIRKYGKNSFLIECILKFETKEEAIESEIQYIKDHKPEYNSTLGGEGRFGGGFTDDGRNRIIEAHKGNQYRLGATHTEEIKESLRELGRKNINIFKKYSHLGPKSLARRVICLDDWMVYPSASEASARYGVAKSALIELCLGQRGRKTVGGFRFAYYEEA